MTTNPSGLPWKWVVDKAQAISVIDKDDKRVALVCIRGDVSHYGEELGNAELIVKAVNSFGPLVEALREAYGLLQFYEPTIMLSNDERGLGFRHDAWMKYMNQIEVTLKNARGEA